jgi:hypothetical protein
VGIIGEVVGRRLIYEELAPNDFRRAASGEVSVTVVYMPLNSWAASVGIPAHMTSTVRKFTGRPARTFREWVIDRADRFRIAAVP